MIEQLLDQFTRADQVLGLAIGVITLTVQYLAGQKNIAAWYIALVGNACWYAYVYVVDTWFLYIMVAAMTGVYINNIRKWRTPTPPSIEGLTRQQLIELRDAVTSALTPDPKATP